MSLYTKKGDGGKTSILRKNRGKSIRLSKASPLIDAIGTIDEANSYLGVVASNFKLKYLKRGLKDAIIKIEEIQKSLFTVGSIIAGSEIPTNNLDVIKLEEEIDKIENALPKLEKFILPGGNLISAQLMFARTLIRRAERKIVFLNNRSKIKSYRIIFMYINRLSDYLFVLARWVNFKAGVKEINWKSR